MPREFSFLVENDDTIGWVRRQPCVCKCETNNPTADDRKIWWRWHVLRLWAETSGAEYVHTHRADPREGGLRNPT